MIDNSSATFIGNSDGYTVQTTIRLPTSTLDKIIFLYRWLACAAQSVSSTGKCASI